MIAETRLWRNVLGEALHQWVYGKGERKVEAEKYLFETENETDLSFVCRFAGMDPKRLRARLAELVARRPQLRQLCGNVHREKPNRRRASNGATSIRQVPRVA
jgi:hypothetical protein